MSTSEIFGIVLSVLTVSTVCALFLYTIRTRRREVRQKSMMLEMDDQFVYLEKFVFSIYEFIMKEELLPEIYSFVKENLDEYCTRFRIFRERDFTPSRIMQRVEEYVYKFN